MKSFLLIMGVIGLSVLTVILGLTAIDAWRDINCSTTRDDCWPTDWREVTFDCFLTASAFIGAMAALWHLVPRQVRG